MKPVQMLDEITYVGVSEGGTKGLRYARVSNASIAARAAAFVATDIIARYADSTFLLKDEGDKWVRGHVGEHSEVGKALLAAYGLDK